MVRAGGLEVVVVRAVGTPIEAAETLTGRWDGGGRTVLAGVRTAWGRLPRGGERPRADSRDGAATRALPREG